MPAPSGNLRQTYIFCNCSVCKTRLSWQFSKEHTGKLSACGFQNSVHLWFHHKIMQAASRSHTKSSQSCYKSVGGKWDKAPCVLNLCIRWVVSLMLEPLYPQRSEPGTYWMPERNIRAPVLNRTQVVKPEAAHIIDWVIPIFRFYIYETKSRVLSTNPTLVSSNTIFIMRL
jgi:hypothetical protein